MKSSFYTILNLHGFLSLIGPDSANFLQGQTTCDLDKVDQNHATLGAYCTPKGRMISSFLVASPVENTIHLRMRRDICESTLAVLSKYIVFSKAEICDTSENLTAIGFYGTESAKWLQEIFGELPSQQYAAKTLDGKTLIQLDQAGELFELWLNAESLNTVLDSCPITEAPLDPWIETNIAAGIGEVCAATQEEFIPQMLNMDITGAVSFSKGCYTGQEVVARMHYRGKSKRRMYAAHFAEQSIAEGAEIRISADGQAVGHVVTATDNAALLVLTEEASQQRQLICNNNIIDLDFQSLPYSIEQTESPTS